MKRLTWRFFAFWGTAFVLYMLAGFMQGHISWAEQDALIYKIGLTGVTVLAFAFVVAYTYTGLFVKGASRWWKTNLATSLVAVTVFLIPSFGSLAWVFLFQNGILKPGFLAWTAISGPIFLSLALAWRSTVWFLALFGQRAERERARIKAEVDHQLVSHGTGSGGSPGGEV